MGMGVVRDAGKDPRSRRNERVMSMAQCEVCGNEYEKAFSGPATNTRRIPTLTVVLDV
jgi:hypothetical protein